MTKTPRPPKTRAPEQSETSIPNSLDLADRLIIQAHKVEVIRFALLGLRNEAAPNTTGIQELCYSLHDELRAIADILAPAPEVAS